MPRVETDRRTIVDRLRAAGWTAEGGAKHEKFAHPQRRGIEILVPRHRVLSPGVARNIARAADWI